MHSTTAKLEEYADFIGDLEGAPDRVIDQAKLFGRTLLFHSSPFHPDEFHLVYEAVADMIRKRTCRR